MKTIDVRYIRLLKLSACMAAAFAIVPLTSCRHEKNELVHDHSHHGAEGAEHEGEEDGHGHESGHAGSHEGEIVLDAHRAETLGVAVTEIQPGEFSTVLEVSGELTGNPSERATVAARSAGIVKLLPALTEGATVAAGQPLASVSAHGMAGGDSNEAAKIALDAAKRELDRLTPLAKDGIVTQRDFNAARQRYEEAKAAASGAGNGAGSSAVAPRGGTVTSVLVRDGEFVDAGQPIAYISANNSLSLRADVPERYARFVTTVTDASFRTAYADDAEEISKYGGRLTGKPSAATSAGGYIPVYFQLKNDGSLVGGTFCTVYLRGTNREGVISVPVEAVTEQQGQNFVYILEHEDAYRKQPVTVGASDGRKIEIVAGLKGGEKVVTGGTTFVRLAETSGVVPEGHSHGG